MALIHLLVPAVLIGLIILVSGAAFVPEWQGIRTALVLGLGGVAVVWALTTAAAAIRSRIYVKSAAPLALAFIALVTVALSLFESPIEGRDVISSVQDPGSDRAIYVVEVSQVPDGFLHTEVLTREGFLPVMQETAVLPYRVRQVSPVDDGAVIEFEVPNPDAEGPRILLQTRHYGFAAGEAR
jgi:hypothetical protein